MGSAASIGIDDSQLSDSQKAELFTHMKGKFEEYYGAAGGAADATLVEKLQEEYASKAKALGVAGSLAVSDKSNGAAAAPDPTAAPDPAATEATAESEAMEVVQLAGAVTDEEAAKQALAFAAKMGISVDQLAPSKAGEAADGATEFRKRRLSLTQAQRRAGSVTVGDANGDRRSSTVMYRSGEMDCATTAKLGLPFGEDKVGTYSCHGVEPSYYDEAGVTAKINQDRACVIYPFGENPQQALFMVLDGHGESGEVVSHYVMHELQTAIESHESLEEDPAKALKDSFLKVDEALGRDHGAEATFSGTTVVAILMRGKHLWIANAGDSRAVMAQLKPDGLSVIAKDLSEDQNPNTPAEQERIISAGGFVSPPPEPGLSARVWLDPEMTQIGLAMARSIGDHAVKKVGVIAEPEVRKHELEAKDQFVILASDGVWEFISSQEAVDIVCDNLKDGCNKATQALIEVAKQTWHRIEGDYRDDCSVIVARVPCIDPNATLEEVVAAAAEAQQQ